MSSGYICSFSNLEIRTVLLDEIMQEPENPSPELVTNMEAKVHKCSKMASSSAIWVSLLSDTFWISSVSKGFQRSAG